MELEIWLRIAETAYAAYAKSTGGKTYDGRNMPIWHELPDKIREAWIQAAKAAVCAHSLETEPRR